MLLLCECRIDTSSQRVVARNYNDCLTTTDILRHHYRTSQKRAQRLQKNTESHLKCFRFHRRHSTPKSVMYLHHIYLSLVLSTLLAPTNSTITIAADTPLKSGIDRANFDTS